ncbi:MAG: hypothetical protein SYC29_14905, partial [Planctomycetota bacterium]|nr:hypothetical protein [Planctomycetota bacterium]
MNENGRTRRRIRSRSSESHIVGHTAECGRLSDAFSVPDAGGRAAISSAGQRHPESPASATDADITCSTRR